MVSKGVNNPFMPENVILLDNALTAFYTDARIDL